MCLKHKRFQPECAYKLQAYKNKICIIIFYHKAPSRSSLASVSTISMVSEIDPDDVTLFTHHVTDDASSIDQEVTTVGEISQISGPTTNDDVDR